IGSFHLFVFSLLTELLPRGADPRGAGVEALQEVLEKLRNRELPPAAKKPGRVPPCLLREPCAVRVGARFGKRCSCPPGTACNLYILQCS
ncbi:CART protein, partial [Odontophorus gujanensis]|nr:CART protein [Odontophorus gujanensis]